MTIHLPKDVESSINEAVMSGRFASLDEAMTEAAHLLLQKLKQGQVGANTPTTTEATPDPLLGSMRDYADEMDEIVADAMKRRREEPWRVIPGE
jgi:Arc/MetJ-type ribon-helix-helix transcriptional regulator